MGIYLFPSSRHQPYINIKLTSSWFYGIKLNRPAIALLIRLRSKHVTTNEHLHKIQITYYPFCDCTDEHISETVNHILFRCTKYGHQRN